MYTSANRYCQQTEVTEFHHDGQTGSLAVKHLREKCEQTFFSEFCFWPQVDTADMLLCDWGSKIKYIHRFRDILQGCRQMLHAEDMLKK